MQIELTSIRDGQPIPEKYAFCTPDDKSHVRPGENVNPGIRWSGVPQQTRSLVLVVVDTDVPTRPDDVNKEDREVPAELPRTNFYHWLMVDIPADCPGLAEGACSSRVTPHGKSETPGPAGSRQGRNDYTGWFADDPSMAGTYLGYDGPCPPWNDALVHRYRFRLYATDLERLPVEGAFSGAEVLTALAGHILAEAQVTGTYTLNPRLRGR